MSVEGDVQQTLKQSREENCETILLSILTTPNIMITHERLKVAAAARRPLRMMGAQTRSQESQSSELIGSIDMLMKSWWDFHDSIWSRGNHSCKGINQDLINTRTTSC